MFPKLRAFKSALTALILAMLGGSAQAQFVSGATPAPERSIRPATLALIINDEQPESLEVAEYYRNARGIPAQNLIHVSIPGNSRALSAADYVSLKKEIERKLPPDIAAVLFVWTTPYAVECNALTAAYTLGMEPDLCKRSCNPTPASPLFDTRSQDLLRDFGLRPSMLLPTQSVEAAKALIDRGVRSDGAWPRGSAYFLKTGDPLRNSRARFFPTSHRLNSHALNLKTISADRLDGEQDVLFYFTGLARVPGLETLKFLPGAVADHLTSVGGDLLGTAQMSSLRWLEAGATGSYGTVSEPCNYWQKFPNPAVLLKHYLAGETLIASYWKSVAWPAQGLFIGEPLAAPYAGRPAWQQR